LLKTAYKTENKMPKFTIQDRIILDDMFELFGRELDKQHEEAELLGKRPIITREYWEYMITEVKTKVDDFTTKKALRQSAANGN